MIWENSILKISINCWSTFFSDTMQLVITCAHKWVESQQQLWVKYVFELLAAPIFSRGAVTFYHLQKISTNIIWCYSEVHKYVHTSGTLTKYFCQMCNFGDFYAIFEFLSRGTFLLNYNYLSICRGTSYLCFGDSYIYVMKS